MMHNQRALFKAIRYFGSQELLAKALGIRRQAISNWLTRDSIPYKHILEIEVATQGYVTHQELASSEDKFNKIIDQIIKYQLNKIHYIPIEKINVHCQLCQNLIKDNFFEMNENRVELELLNPILVDTHYQLLSCPCGLNVYKKLGARYVAAKIIHLF